MEPGTYRNRISIAGETIVDDPDYGPLPGGWAVIHARIAANVQDVMPSKSESVEQGLAIAKNRTRIRFRYRPGITSAMRITVHGAVEREVQIIGGPAILGNREEIEVMCEAYSS